MARPNMGPGALSDAAARPPALLPEEAEALQHYGGVPGASANRGQLARDALDPYPQLSNRERADNARVAATDENEEHDLPNHILIDSPKPLSWDEFAQLVEENPEELFTRQRRILLPPLLSSWEGVNMMPVAIYLDYFMVLGKPYQTIFDATHAGFASMFHMKAADWNKPLRLKAGAIGFDVTSSSFFLGSCDMGDVFLVWSSPNGQDSSERLGADEDGRLVDETALRPSEAQAIIQYIAEVFGREEALSSHGISGVGTLNHTYVAVDIPWSSLCTFVDAFMTGYSTKVRPRLGSLGTHKVPRLLMYKYGQNEEVPADRDNFINKLKKDAVKIHVEELRRLGAEGAAVYFEQFNFYSGVKQRIRPTIFLMALAQGTFTQGLSTTQAMLSPAQWNHESYRNKRHAARTLRPREEWQRALKELNVKTSGIRLEWTARLKVKELPRRDRKWDGIIRRFLVPTAGVISKVGASLVQTGLIVPLEPSAFPAFLSLSTKPLFEVIQRVIRRADSRPIFELTLAEREIVAIAERLLMFAATGSPRVNLALFKSSGLSESLRKRSYPYINPDIINMWTGEIDFNRYAPDENKDYAHVAAIKYAFDSVAGGRAMAIAEIERTNTLMDGTEMSENGLQHIADHFVTHVLIPEFRELARRRYLQKIRDDLKSSLAAAGDQEVRIQDAHDRAQKQTLAVSEWNCSSNPFAIATVMRLFSSIGEDKPPELVDKFVAKYLDINGETFFVKDIMSFDEVARFIVTRSYPEAKLALTAEGVGLTAPKQLNWPNLLRSLVKIQNAASTGKYANRPTEDNMQPTVAPVELSSAIAEALFRCGFETWPASGQGALADKASWIKLMYLAPYRLVAIDPTPHRAKRRRLDGEEEVIYLSDDEDDAGGTGSDASTGLTPPTESARRICRLYDLRFDIVGANSFPPTWNQAKAYFLLKAQERVSSTATANKKIGPGYFPRWRRILNSFDPTKKSHWLIYTMARMWTMRTENIPYIKMPGPLVTYNRNMWAKEPLSKSLEKKRAPRILLPLFVGLFLVYSTPALQEVGDGECQWSELLTSMTDRHFDSGVWACMGLGTQHRRGNTKFPNNGEFTPLSEDQLDQM
ncbi:hypothetical protein Rhopal_006051-T1 [Rhodotorula paludigena]|uniref:Uncharacterized protein n=1 Tax=Rhodotorula paludigena TaxID=86838 RepID=A0AAV5GKZ3_9BASI|nr:hypothetical protein Rhopal_006051-T1 [Rhodotorula paludigena]